MKCQIFTSDFVSKMDSKRKKTVKKINKKPEKIKYNNGTYSVVKFAHEIDKIFECLPDLWFIDENKHLCFWPPKSGKSFTLRAMNQEEPDDTWEVYECEVISEGHATYSIGSSIVREKCSQSYNTSSAEEHLQAAKFRRQHPGLIDENEKSFENIFASPKDVQTVQNEKENSNNTYNNSHTRSGSKTHSKSSKHPKSRESSDSSSSNTHHYRSGRSSNSSSSKTHSDSDRTTHSRVSKNNQMRTGGRSDSRSIMTDSVRKSHSRASHKNQMRKSGNSNSRSSHKNQMRTGGNSNSRSISKTDSNIDRTPSSNGNSSRSGVRSHSRSIITHSDSIRTSYSRPSNKKQMQIGGNCHSRLISKTHPFNDRTTHLRSSNGRSHSRSSITESRSIRTSNSRANNKNQMQTDGTHLRSLSKSHSNIENRTHLRLSNGNRSRSGGSRSSITDSRSENTNLLRSGENRDSRSSSRPHTQSSEESFRKFRLSLSSRHRSQTNNKSDSRLDSLDPKNRSRSKVESRVHSRSSQSSRGRSRSRSILRSRSRSIPITTRLPNFPSSSPSRRLEKLIRPADESYRRADSQNLPQTNVILESLIRDVKKLTTTVNNNNRRYDENDRRLARMEVTVNKTFIMVGDMSHAANIRMSVGNNLPRDVKLPRGYHMPRLPVKRLGELLTLHRDLKNKDFFSFLVEDQKEYCSPTNATDTVIMTSYLKRFIEVDIRASLVLKDSKGQPGNTLYKDFHRVYDFLIAVMKAGYLNRNKVISDHDVHVVLRTVWGRSKQLLAEANKKN